MNASRPITDPLLYRGADKTVTVQAILAALIGLSAFLLFAFLRVKYPKIYVANFNQINHNYLHSSSRQNLPKLPNSSLFGWIPVVYRVDELQVLEHAGLDAVVFLGFFKMAIKVLASCVFLALFVMSPIRYKLTGKLDQDYPPDKNDKKGYLNNQYLIWIYVAFTYVVTGIVMHFLFKQTNKIVDMRQKYLGKQNSITDRTVKLLGITGNLRDEERLKNHIESLGLGKIESITIVREWNELNKLFKLRRNVLDKLERSWVEFFEINGIKKKNDLLSTNLLRLGDAISLENEPIGGYTDEVDGSELQQSNRMISEVSSNLEASIEPRSSIINQLSDQDAIESVSPDSFLDDESLKRPKLRVHFYKIWEPPVDAISYYTEKLELIDKQIQKPEQKNIQPLLQHF